MFHLLFLCLMLTNVDKVLSTFCRASTLEDFHCMDIVSEDTRYEVSVHWSLLPDGEKVKFGLEVSAQNDPGYISLGFPTKPGEMIGSYAVISEIGGVFTYTLIEKFGVYNVLGDWSQTITPASITRDEGVAILRFTRSLDNGGAHKLTAGPTHLVWAFSEDSSQRIHAYHGDRYGTGLVDLSLTSDDRSDNGSEDSSNNGSEDGPDDGSQDASDDGPLDSSSSCTASNLEGLECSLTLNKAGHGVMHWAVAADRASISFAVAAATEGYVAVGFSRSGKMRDTDAVIGSQANGVETYALTGSSATRDKSQTLLSSSVEYDASTGVTLLRFSRALDNGGLSIIDLSAHTDMVWAYAADNSPDVKDHGPNKGRFKIHFESGEAGVTDGFNTVLLHGALMVAAWALLVPGGVLIARFGKPLGDIWFKLHRGVQSLALLTAAAGLIVAVTQFDPRAASTHGYLGVAVIFVAFTMPLNALLRPNPDTPRHRVKWNMLHHWLGRAAVVMGFVNLFFGLDKAEEQDGELDSYKILRGVVYFGLLGSVVFGVVLEVKKRCVLGVQKEGGRAKMMEEGTGGKSLLFRN